MTVTEHQHHKHKVHLERFAVLAPIPPFVDVIMQCTPICPQDFAKVTELATSYPNDPRLIEMVRKGGDASAKVPYLMDYGETAQSILETLREIAAPHAEHLKKLPGPMQATIHTLLSINMVPDKYGEYSIPALLEIGRMQKEITESLHSLMAGRKLAQAFFEDNRIALGMLDREWMNLRNGIIPMIFGQSMPEHPQMRYIPSFHRNCLVALREVCVIVDPPDAQELKRLTPVILQNPLPEHEMPPVTGSVDWLLRMVGKVGRHFTRAMLDIIAMHLEAEKVLPGPHNYERINYEAQDALRWFVTSNP